MKVLDLVSAALANYRLSVLLSKDKIAEPIRALVGCNASTGDKRWCFVADLVNCPYCLGVWFAALVWLLQRFKLGRIFVEILAIAGAQDLIQSMSDNVSSGGQDAA